MPNSDDVSRIHGKYSVTLLAPSSKIRSFVYSMIAATAFVAAAVFGFVPEENLAVRLGMVMAVLAAAQALDSRLIRNRDYSKAIHLSLYSNMLWLISLLTVLAAAAILSRPEASVVYIGIGMFVVSSFRIGLLTTVLGVDVKLAWGICLIQPLAVFLVLVPSEMWLPALYNPLTLGFGILFMALSTIWSILTDRAGRPDLHSTHSLIQAYLYSREDIGKIESILEEHSKPSKISTAQLRLKAEERDVRLVLPEIHPGPFHPIGGSNISYRIYQTLDSSAMVMHSISDHALNLPSGQQVEYYLQSLSKASLAGTGASCTEPATVQINRARAVGIRFDKSAMLLLSLSPHGMEDLPSYIKKDIEEYSRNRNFERVMIVDCHNAMGQEISGDDSIDMLKAARSCLDSLVTKEDHPFEFGYANSSDMDIFVPDLAMGGLAVLCLGIGDRKYFIGWADSNNMENGIREYVVERLARDGYSLIEISTSDTHFTQSPVRTKQGYYQFGAITTREDISEWYLGLARRAAKTLTPGSFEILENQTDLQVMGPKIFEDFSGALDSSLRLSKIFMAAGVALFLTSLLL
jgi:putative membrane protein